MSILAPGPLPERYGTRRPWRRLLALGVVAGLVMLALGWLAWAILAHSTPQVRSGLVSYEITGEHSARARLEVVRRDADVTARCLLRATAADHAIVGELRFTVGPGGEVSTRTARTMRTERRATAVQLLGCTAEGQRRPR